MKADKQGKPFDFSQPQGICIDTDRVEEVHSSMSGQPSASDRLRHLAQEGLGRRLANVPADADSNTYRDRLEAELADISDVGFAPFMLVAHEAQAWARKEGIAVGTGTGAVCGSVTAWALGITSIDPLHYGLLFESFLNRERVAFPYICVPFGERNIHAVAAHLIAIYGEDAVSTLPQEFEPACLGYAKVVLYMVASPHLDVIAELPQNTGKLLFDDPATWAFMAKGASDDIYQANTLHLGEYLQKVQPTCLEELAALLALSGPKPIGAGMLDSFVHNRGKGSSTAEGLGHVHDILQRTRGLLVYHEQVMEILQYMSGETLGVADILRRYMVGTDPDRMAYVRECLLQGAAQKGIPASNALVALDMLSNGIQYCSNSYRTVAEAMFMYQTAWLKVHYPEEYATAHAKIFPAGSSVD